MPADLMESRNLATAQEMVQTGNYLVPTMNGKLRLEKPPLPTWIGAGIELVWPFNLSAQRAAAGMAATMMVVFLFLLVRELSREPDLALLAALILATSYNPIMLGRTATWDIYCHSFMLGSIWLMSRGLRGLEKQWGRFLLAGMCMGLSFLSKGPVAFYAMLLPFLIGYFVTFRPSLQNKVGPVISMVLVCLAISLWWPLTITLFHLESGIAVAAQESGAWLSRSVRPIWYYWRFSAEAGIWTLVWVTALLSFFLCKRKAQHQIFCLSILWTLMTLVLLSIIPEKKPRYLLPMVIPGAISIAVYLWYSIRLDLSHKEKIALRINGSIISILAVVSPIVLYVFLSREAEEGELALLPFLLSSVVYAGAAIYILTGLYSRKAFRPIRFIAGTVVIMLCFLTFSYKQAMDIIVNDQRYSIAELRKYEGIVDIPFYFPSNEHVGMKLVYEVGRAIHPLNMADPDIVHKTVPFVAVCDSKIELPFAGMDVETNFVGVFDNNWRRPGNHRRNSDLEKQVWLITPKAGEDAIQTE